ncbi:MAG: right-handed parallel beta-helix repeat-containing protein [Marinilabiliaceae bacterium]|nr:right-handed parallel beta-helix repeat-containing protein [Marinilabiliaceae bacterium]
MARVQIVFFILLLHQGLFSTPFVNITHFGANGFDEEVDSEAVNKAILFTSKQGGGTVFFPAGTYICFSIRLQSNITLLLDNGCKLIAADTVKYGLGFDIAEINESDQYQDYGHSHWQNSLIWGDSIENIFIIGNGIIDGTGGLTRSGMRTKGIANKAIALKNCRNVTIRDISMLMCGHFALLATGVDQLTLDNIKVDTNRDGFDIDCCKHVRISNCSVNSPWDDAICLKSSYALGYARVTEDVTITNCYVSGFDRTTFLNGTYKKEEYQTVPDKGVVTGRIKFGTESNGGFRNITISNCTFEFCRGLALETVDGGVLEDVNVNNLVMKDIQGAPFFFRLGARMRGPENTPVGVFRRVNISDVIVYSKNPDYCSMIVGIPDHPVEDITLRNIRIRLKGGASKLQSKNIVDEHISSYPDPQEFGKMPASAFFIRHAANIQISDVVLELEENDERPLIIIEDVDDIVFDNIKIQSDVKVYNIEGRGFKKMKLINSFGSKNKTISSNKDFVM